MSPEEFRKIGRDLFGPSFHEPMARAVGKSRRTIFYYAAGKVAIPKSVEISLTHIPAKLLRQMACTGKQ